jgi:hypothetical protein
LILEFIRRTTTKKVQSFSNFVEKIRICIPFDPSLNYVCDTISEGANKIKSDKPPYFIYTNRLIFSIKPNITTILQGYKRIFRSLKKLSNEFGLMINKK